MKTTTTRKTKTTGERTIRINDRVSIEKAWDGNETTIERGNRVYTSAGRWSWVVVVDDSADLPFDTLREAKHRADQIIAAQGWTRKFVDDYQRTHKVGPPTSTTEDPATIRRRAADRLAHGATFETLTRAERDAVQGTTKTTTLRVVPPTKTPSSGFFAALAASKTAKAAKAANAPAVAKRSAGRPSTVADKGARLTIRLPLKLRTKLEARAATLGVSLSDAAAIVLEAGLGVRS